MKDLSSYPNLLPGLSKSELVKKNNKLPFWAKPQTILPKYRKSSGMNVVKRVGVKTGFKAKAQ